MLIVWIGGGYEGYPTDPGEFLVVSYVLWHAYNAK
jgi:hypothetical protein